MNIIQKLKSRLRIKSKRNHKISPKGRATFVLVNDLKQDKLVSEEAKL